jgi:hypothetical protein
MALNGLISGDSASSGWGLGNVGLADQRTNPRIWAAQLIRKLDNDASVTNVSVAGASNHDIFKNTAFELINNQYDIAIVQWSLFYRKSYNIGLELYSTRTLLQDNQDDINIVNGVTYPGPWLTKLGDNLRSMFNPHWAILDIIHYTNILTEIQKLKGGRIAFAHCRYGWDKDFFIEKQIKTPSELSKFQQNMLSSDLRCDQDTIELYHQCQKQYQQAGGLNPDHWLPWGSTLCDIAIDRIESWKEPDQSGWHPGVLSHDMYANLFAPTLRKIMEKTHD